MGERPGEAAEVLVIACGNPMRGDDGVGPVVAERVERTLPESLRGRCRFIITHQLLPEHVLELSLVRRAVLIDARLPEADETIGRTRVERVVPEPDAGPCAGCGAETGLTHHWTLPRLLRMASELFGHCPEAYTVSITTDLFDTPDTLSPPIRAGLPQLCDHIQRLLPPS